MEERKEGRQAAVGFSGRTGFVFKLCILKRRTKKRGKK
jgi:hypothetical protein